MNSDHDCLNIIYLSDKNLHLAAELSSPKVCCLGWTFFCLVHTFVEKEIVQSDSSEYLVSAEHHANQDLHAYLNKQNSILPITPLKVYLDTIARCILK